MFTCPEPPKNWCGAFGHWAAFSHWLLGACWAEQVVDSRRRTPLRACLEKRRRCQSFVGCKQIGLRSEP